MLLFWEAKEWTTAIENIYEREREREILLVQSGKY